MTRGMKAGEVCGLCGGKGWRIVRWPLGSNLQRTVPCCDCNPAGDIKRRNDEGGGTDADAARFSTANDRICDHAWPDQNAGLHKHAVLNDDGIYQCICCGRVWTDAARRQA